MFVDFFTASCFRQIFPCYTGLEAAFSEVFGTKVLRVFLLTIHIHLYCTNGFYSPPPTPSALSKCGLKLVWTVNIVYGNLKFENSQDFAQKSQRNCTFLNSASGFFSCCGHDLERERERWQLFHLEKIETKRPPWKHWKDIFAHFLIWEKDEVLEDFKNHNSTQLYT